MWVDLFDGKEWYRGDMPGQVYFLRARLGQFLNANSGGWIKLQQQMAYTVSLVPIVTLTQRAAEHGVVLGTVKFGPESYVWLNNVTSGRVYLDNIGSLLQVEFAHAFRD